MTRTGDDPLPAGEECASCRRPCEAGEGWISRSYRHVHGEIVGVDRRRYCGVCRGRIFGDRPAAETWRDRPPML